MKANTEELGNEITTVCQDLLMWMISRNGPVYKTVSNKQRIKSRSVSHCVGPKKEESHALKQ